jgi:hypothetical protein
MPCRHILSATEGGYDYFQVFTISFLPYKGRNGQNLLLLEWCFFQVFTFSFIPLYKFLSLFIKIKTCYMFLLMKKYIKIENIQDQETNRLLSFILICIWADIAQRWCSWFVIIRLSVQVWLSAVFYQKMNSFS